MHFRQVRELKRMGSVHSVMKFFSASVGFSCAAVALNALHLLAVASNGVGIIIFKWFAEGSDVIGQLSFILVLLSAARGWTITSAVLEGRGMLICLFSAVGMLYLCFFVWQSSFMYANVYSSTLGLFDTYPGILLVGIRVMILAFFSGFVYASHRACNHSAQKAFLKRFGLIFIAWQIGFLVCIALAQATHFYSTKMWNTLAYLSFGCGGMSMYMYLTWPSRIGEYFDMSSVRATGNNDRETAGPTIAAMPGPADVAQRMGENSTVASSTTPYDRL